MNYNLSRFSLIELESEIKKRKDYSDNYLICYVTGVHLDLVPIKGYIKNIEIYKYCLKKVKYFNHYYYVDGGINENLLFQIEELPNLKISNHRTKFLEILITYIKFHTDFLYEGNRDFEGKFLIIRFEINGESLTFNFNKFDIQEIL